MHTLKSWYLKLNTLHVEKFWTAAVGQTLKQRAKNIGELIVL